MAHVAFGGERPLSTVNSNVAETSKPTPESSGTELRIAAQPEGGVNQLRPTESASSAAKPVDGKAVDVAQVLDRQLDQLLSDAASKSANASPTPAPDAHPNGPPQARSALAPKRAVEPEPKASEGKTAGGADLVGDDLANQIQSLLDDAKTADADSKTSESSVTPATAGSESEAAVAAPKAKSPDLGEIDRMLAEAADNAVAGDFETVSEVLASHQQELAAKQAVEKQASDTTMAAPPAAATEFVSVEAVLASATVASGEGATAADVARELDSQPEQQSAAAAAPTPTAVVAEPTEQIPPKPRPGLLDAMRVLCAIISAPTRGASPAVRGAIGYFALVQFFIASVVLIGKAAAVFMR